MYDPENSSIALATILKAFCPEYDKNVEIRKTDLLRILQEKKIFVIDACLCPVKRTKKTTKEEEKTTEFIRKCATAYLNREIARVKPQKKIIVAKANLLWRLEDILRKSKHADKVLREKVPFPGCGQQNRFKAVIRLAREAGKL